jgi:hypothetical protein
LRFTENSWLSNFAARLTGHAQTMSGILRFKRPDAAFDPDTLTILGDVYDRACASFCECKSSPVCDEMANRIFAAAMKGELDPDRLWQVAVEPFYAR